MTVKERHEREEKLLAQIREIGESIRDITPENGHLSMSWFPDGYMYVFLFSGSKIQNKDGSETADMLLDAWAETKNGKLKVYRA